ncbi:MULTISPECIES: hypothetical protein [Chelativorans]|uniref:hypothetical protein n=1 Tax=Chelativorans TaxID=449972 RepID=UPI00140D14B9|nr:MULTISPECIES: hypothetical protein [Chelativorans]
MVNPIAQALQPLQPFIWGRGGAKLTPEQIAREREIAEALGVVDTSPVDHWLQGAARMANTLTGRIREGRADRAERENQAFNEDIVSSLLGSVGGTTTPAPTSPAAQPLDYASQRVSQAHGDMGAYRNAIASIESAGSGDYQAVGPAHPTLGRALGRYQVMEANVGLWTEKHLGHRLTPEEFLASPEAQDAVFDGEFGSYVQRFGDPAIAAQAWFAGPGGVGTERQDSLGTSVPEYAQKFTTALGRTPAQGGIQAQLESLPVGGSMTMPRGSTSPVAAALAMQPGASLPRTATPGSITRGPDGQTYQYVETRGMAGAQGDYGWKPVNTGSAQTAQAGGINPAIIEALSSPYANEGTRRIAALLLEQQMQPREAQPLINAGDGRLYDPNTGQWVIAPQGEPQLPESAQTLQWRAQQAGLVPGTPEYNEFMISGGRGGTSLSIGPDGTVQFSQGNAARPLTEAQSKDAVYATRAEGALGTLDQFDTALTSASERVAEYDPTGVVRGMQSEEFQKAQQAGLEFLQAILRKDTGAAIAKEELDQYGRTYLPQPGDGPAVLEQKRMARRRALEALKAGMAPQAILNQEKALEQSSVQPAPGSGATGVPAGVDPADWQYMTPEERALFQ